MWCPDCGYSASVKIGYGTDPHTIHRKDAPDTSVAAAHRVDTAKDEEAIFKMFCNAMATHGLTVKDIAKRMGKQVNQISGRLTALQDKKMIEDSGIRRDGCRVMRVKLTEREGP